MSIKILYIAGSTHSGTTLLNRILGAHQQIFNVGGIKNLSKTFTGRKKCSCRSESLDSCPFWGSVERTLQNETGKRLQDLQINAAETGVFSRDNFLLLKAIQKAGNCDMIVDSSRKIKRLAKLSIVPGIEIYPIHLFKFPPAQAASWKKTGRPVIKGVKKYWKDNYPLLRFLRNRPEPVWVSYENLCKDPEAQIRRILIAPGIDFEPDMLSNWGKKELHVLGGNRMRRSDSSKIRLDVKWRETLTSWEKAVMLFGCYPLWKKLKCRADALPI